MVLLRAVASCLLISLSVQQCSGAAGSSRWATKQRNMPERRAALAGATSSPSPAALETALVVRGGAKVLTMDRGLIGTMLLMFKSFFVSLMDPTYMMPEPTSGASGGDMAEGGSSAEVEDPFALRHKAGLDHAGHHRTISVDELEKMGGGDGKSRVKAISSAAAFKKALQMAGKKLVVVDFFATWCGPCKQIAPQFAELSGAHKKVMFLKVDVDHNRDLSGKYEVSSMPTFLFMKNGKVLDKMAGANIVSIKQKIGSYA